MDNVVPLGQSCRQVSTRSQTKSSWLASQSMDGGTLKGPCTNAVVKMPKTHGNQVDLQGLKKTVSEWMRGFSSVELSAVQKNDTVLGELQRWIERGGKPKPTEAMSLSPALPCYWLNYKLFWCINGVLYLEWQDPCPGFSPVWKVLVPASLKEEAPRLCHDSLFTGHMGVRRTLNPVRRGFHWYEIQRDVKLHIRVCPTCAKRNMPYRKYRASMITFRAGAPMDCLGVDIMGPLPCTKQGNRYLFVISDYFTRWVEAFPLPDQKAKTVVQVLVHEFICRFRTWLEIHSDQGRNFESTLFQEVCLLLRVLNSRSTPYHPSSNALIAPWPHSYRATSRNTRKSGTCMFWFWRARIVTQSIHPLDSCQIT